MILWLRITKETTYQKIKLSASVVSGKTNFEFINQDNIQDSDTTHYLSESIEIIGHFNETINNKGVRYYIVNDKFMEEFFVKRKL